MVSDPKYYWAVRARVFGALVSVALLLFLTWSALFTVPGQNLDNLGMEALRGRASLIPAGLSLLTHFVSAPALAIVGLFVLGITIVRKRPALGLRAIVIVAGANLLVQLVKAGLSRPELQVGWDLPNSFPSGHTAFAASISAALVVVVPKRFRSHAAVFGTVWTALMVAVVVAQGWHRPSDTVGAILAVAIWAFLLAPVETGRSTKPYAVGIILVITVLSVGVAAMVLGIGITFSHLGTPMAFDELAGVTEKGALAGQVFAVAAVLVPTGFQGLMMAGLDALSLKDKRD